MELETERLVLRQWQIEDVPIFAAINSDEKAMQHFPYLFTQQQSNELAARIQDEITSKGWGLWAAEIKNTGEFIGFVGLSTPEPIFTFTPCTEIGWRLHPRYWGQGYATEAGRRSLAFAFTELALAEVLAMTAVTNVRSVAVMKRLGLNDTGQNFEHPKIPIDNPVCEHCLYSITREDWDKLNPSPAGEKRV